MRRFERLGVNYRFAPDEVRVVLHFSRPERSGDSWEVSVDRRDGGHVFTRRINLLTSPSSGNIKVLIEELVKDRVGEAAMLQGLMREACESVLASHRNGREVQRTEGRIERPPPPKWLCRGLLLKDKPNTWLGAASTGKSTLAKAMCAYYAAGYRFCDREMEQGVPLYLDWEDDYASFNRAVYDVCHNLGVSPELPLMLWLDMHGYRLRDQVEAITRVIEREHVGLLVLDAVAASGGSPGEHMNYETIALEMSDCLDALPAVTVLALDHVTGAEHKALANNRDGRPIVPIKARGSERKLEYFRNQWSLVAEPAAEESGRHVIHWTHTKFNLGAKERPGFTTEISHLPDEISIAWHPDTGAVMAESPLADDTRTEQLLDELARVTWATPRELVWRVDGAEPNRSQENSARILLDRVWRRGQIFKDADERGRTRYACKQGASQSPLIPFPGGA